MFNVGVSEAFGLLLVILFGAICVVALMVAGFVVGRRSASTSSAPRPRPSWAAAPRPLNPPADPESLLDLRLARGEIEVEDYRVRREALGRGRSASEGYESGSTTI